MGFEVPTSNISQQVQVDGESLDQPPSSLTYSQLSRITGTALAKRVLSIALAKNVDVAALLQKPTVHGYNPVLMACSQGNAVVLRQFLTVLTESHSPKQLSWLTEVDRNCVDIATAKGFTEVVDVWQDFFEPATGDTGDAGGVVTGEATETESVYGSLESEPLLITDRREDVVPTCTDCGWRGVALSELEASGLLQRSADHQKGNSDLREVVRLNPRITAQLEPTDTFNYSALDDHDSVVARRLILERQEPLLLVDGAKLLFDTLEKRNAWSRKGLLDVFGTDEVGQ